VAIVSALVARAFLEAGRVAEVAVEGLRLSRPLNLVRRPGAGLGRLEAAFLDVSGIQTGGGARRGRE
jgi:hypothetical protein